MDAEAALQRLSSSQHGLSSEDAARRLSAHGPNRLPTARRRSVLTRFLGQFHNVLIYVLLAAGAATLLLGHLSDSLVIAGVVLVNAVVGFIQEGRAERSIDAIRAMMNPRAGVMRAGHRGNLAAEDIVPGDIVLLEAGDRVPADLRLLRAHNLTIDEAVLTGESVAATKQIEPVRADAALGDRASMAYSGSLVAAGHGLGVVVGTGRDTQIGRISTMIGAVESLSTPLMRAMDRFARQVSAAILGISALVFAIAVLWRDYTLDSALMVVVGLAVAAIPEGLPAVMTITLAVGVRRMARRNAIIRRLPAVETLGAVSVICSDKTGTLTRNEMTVRGLYTADGAVSVEGVGYATQGDFKREGMRLEPAADPVLSRLLHAAVLCNDAQLHTVDGASTVDGDPMEGALLVLAVKGGLDPARARADYPRRDEIPFDARHRYMASLNDTDGGPIIYVKGAPERILDMCVDVAAAAGHRPLDRATWDAATQHAAAEGQRVIALACRHAADSEARLSPERVEEGLTLLGLVGLIDPARSEAKEAVRECRTAGIALKMITGDHAETARAIAIQLALADDPEVITGAELDQMDDATLRATAAAMTVFARTSPEHKLRLVSALQANGSVVAMTGDGVNDAPALKRADIGVAMGGKGTEAAKEASEMVLADDNFATIVAAVREGRTVYDNLTKVLAWTLPTNGGEALTIICAVLFGLVLPVTPIQILWVNMVTAVALGLTLAFEPTEPGTMRRHPRAAGAPLLSGRLVWRIMFVSVLMAAGAFGVQAIAETWGHDTETARTMVVNALVAMEVFYLFSVRFIHGTSLTFPGLLGTPAVLSGLAGVIACQLAFTYAAPLQAIFETRALSLSDLLAVAGAGGILLVVVEVEKRLFGLWSRGHRPERSRATHGGNQK
ncbi:HAD-IC family P-type ATPase [Xanthobacter autotrophicus]|nr:HAD-IC family P-type ATPase [Xanthobacter autotrophicus]MDI4663506.1 HAD-IC family P-type ATPase [Xanthobacter autotrophicus]